MLPPPPGCARGNGAVAAAVILCLALAALALFRDELGLTRLLAK